MNDLRAFRKYPRQTLAVLGCGYNLDIFFHNAHVAVFPEIGIVFNRIKKSGNTTVSAFLKDLSGGVVGGDYDGFKRSILRPNLMSPVEIRAMKSYYTFTVVRDPYARALSGFLNKVAPGVEQKYSVFGGFGDSTSKGFVDFLSSLSIGGRIKNRHFWPQSDLLYQPVDRFHSIARLETLVDDMSDILTNVGLPPHLAKALQSPHKVEVGKKKITSSAERLEYFYNRTSVDMVREIYQKDFSIFNYPQELYAIDRRLY